MARAKKKTAKQDSDLSKLRPRKPRQPNRLTRWVLWIRRWTLRALVLVAVALVLWVAAYRWINPGSTPYMRSEASRLGSVDSAWVDANEVAPVLFRSIVAAEDANFCQHWGFDMGAIRNALEDGATRGGSSLTQQVAKNVFLWHGRSWTRKALEAVFTPVIEATWSKQRILEVYVNVAEFDEGVFGVEAAARHYFGVGPEDLSATQAARLAAILPAPKSRSAANPSAFVQRRSSSIRDGAETIRRDGRAACFEDK